MSSLTQLKQYWRRFKSLKDDDVKSDSFLKKEFLKGAAFLDDAVSRRHFLKIMGASAALMGAGCAIRKPVQKIRPYAKNPEYAVPGDSLYYATSLAIGEDVVGLLGNVSEGRPTKLEGNPLHPLSNGSTGTFHQANILSLYDPDRLQYGRLNNNRLSQSQMTDALNRVYRRYLSTEGRGLSFLLESQMSPTVYSLLSKLQLRLPYAEFYRYDPINMDNVKHGLFNVAGKFMLPQFNFEKADVVVSFDHDFLGGLMNHVSNAAGFSKRRSPEDANLNRLYAFESNYSATGARSDHRFRVWSSQIPLVLFQLIRSLNSYGVFDFGPKLSQFNLKFSKEDVVDPALMNEIALDLINAKGKSVVTAGPLQPAIVHEFVYFINQALLNNNHTVHYYEDPFSNFLFNQQTSVKSMTQLVDNIKDHQVSTLIVLGGDPVFNAPADSLFKELYVEIDETICFSMMDTETARLSKLVIPRYHFLESWGDTKSISGIASLVQPMIRPMHLGYSDVGFLGALLDDSRSDYAHVRRTWRLKYGRNMFDQRWARWLHDGVISTVQKSVKLSAKRITSKMVAQFSDLVSSLFTLKGIELNFFEDSSVYDGRFINNGWLQEMPDPITKLTWDNALLMSVKTAKKYHLKFQDMVKLVKGNLSLELPVYVLPGHMDNSVSIALGYGQNCGRVGSGTGFNAYQLRTRSDFDGASMVSLVKLNRTYKLASTQDHGSMEGRALYRSGTISQYEKQPTFAADMVQTPPLKSLYDEVPYDTGYQWGMVVDLSRCDGCNACIISCQAENNIPIVGKREVLNGREMSWMRIDRYFEGDEDNPDIVDQPVSCLHCENAPCEQVCPVAATVHDQEGINNMVYNRCIGTRYCADNCPVKVRRFNFFDYHQRNPQSQPKKRKHLFDYVREPDPIVQRQFNPDVTVRMRGVMEKCTYCIQRINRAKINAKNQNRLVSDADIQVACQQTCSADAITFGNILDPDSKVSKVRKRQRNYQLLEQLHLKARTTYLAGITNPNVKIVQLTDKRKL